MIYSSIYLKLNYGKWYSIYPPLNGIV